jgi:Arc/MetJ family transcription regulator
MRTTVNVDGELLEAARQALGTDGVSETVNAALDDVARRAKLGGFDVRAFDVTDADIAAARRDRLSGPRQ